MSLDGNEAVEHLVKAQELAKAKAELESDVLRADENTSARAQERLAQLAFAPGHPYRLPGRAAKLQSLGVLGVSELIPRP